MFPSKFLQFPSILTHFHAANEKFQMADAISPYLAVSCGLRLLPSFYSGSNQYHILIFNVWILFFHGIQNACPTSLMKFYCSMSSSKTFVCSCWLRSLVGITYWGADKTAEVVRMIFWNVFSVQKGCCFDWYFTEIYFWCPADNNLF